MKHLAFVCLIAAVQAQEAPKPPAPSAEATGHEATREEMQKRLGELMAFARTTGAQGEAMRIELLKSEPALWDRSRARKTEIASLEKKSAAGEETATKRITELRAEDTADEAAWKKNAAELKSKQSTFWEKLEPWNREFELAAGSVLRGKGVLESGSGLTEIKAHLPSGRLIYRWQGTAQKGKPELEIRMGFQQLPDLSANFGNPTRKIGGTGTVMMEREHMAAVVFEKFHMEVELGHWEQGGKTPLEVAAQAIDFDALGALKVAMAGAEPAKQDHTLPRLPLQPTRPPGSPLSREEQVEAFSGFFREALQLGKRVKEIDAEEREESNRLSLRREESGIQALSDEMDRLRREQRAGKTGTEKAYAEAKAKWLALTEKENAPIRAIADRKLTLLRDAELKHPKFEAAAASILTPSASLPDGVGLARIETRLQEGVVWLHWDTMPESKQSAATVFLKLFHRPDGFEKANPVKGMIHGKWPVIIDGPNNVRIWLHELQMDVSVSPEWQARGIQPKDLAESILDFDALEKMDAAAKP